ncbi:MAG TPA: ABC transporter ATP-binding protein [Thermomicrobiales bacterium]|nr:ABC transporter ATP-binding protein [Thermomicrobiales bacterium]
MAVTVSLSGVEKRYQQGQEELPVLHDIDLTIGAGEFVALLGPSGCGKSTLLRLLGGLDQPSEGEVRLGDQVVTEADSRTAVVFQEPRLFPWKSVAANVALGARRLKKKPSPDALLDLVGLTGFGRSYPHQLSGGMAQRAALARALIGEPGVLLLDEPFAALDALTRMQMQDLVADVHAKLRPTVVMVTHDVSEALHLADRIILLSQRPATVAATIRLPFPRPRSRGDADLAALEAEILTHFGFPMDVAPPRVAAVAA